MRQLQKRYLYSAILSAVFFIATYGIFDFNLILSIILTVLIYVGGIFLFKDKDIRSMSPENVDNYYFMASKCVNLASHIEDENIKNNIDGIAVYTDEILLSLTQRPKKVEQVFDFFDYYLDMTYKILQRYNMAEKHDKKTAKDKDFIKNSPTYIEKISKCFKRQLDNMKEARMLDIESEIRLFEHNIGLKRDEIEVGDKNEFD